MNAETVSAINTLGRFCGQRDIERPERGMLRERYGFDQADVFVLFGGSVLEGGDVLAGVIREQLASVTVIVGGAGHTTETLRTTVHHAYPDIETAGLPEAVIFQKYLEKVHGLKADFLETESTNCGNNITNLLELIRNRGIACRSMILCQDASMQKRMDAGFRKHAPNDMTVINYAAYRAVVEEKDGALRYTAPIHGMWDMDRYVHLLMGEIPRLMDDENGYGPKGKGFIAHTDVPEDVLRAFHVLQDVYGGKIREANPLYASSGR